MNARKALADWLDQRVAARAAQKRPRLDPTSAALMEPEIIALSEPAEPQANDHVRHTLHRALQGRPVLETCEPAEAESVETAGSSAVEIDSEAMGRLDQEAGASSTRSFADLWQAMGPAQATPAKPPAPSPAPPQPRFELIRGANETGIPSGMHDEATLRRLILAGKRFSGFVLFIGVTDAHGRLATDKDLLRTIEIFVAGLLRENEFGCRYGADEFVVLLPEKHGEEAQLRLTTLSEQLWDYQLREAGRFSIVFAWGSAERHHESLGEGIAEAAERMQETRRTRRLVSVDMLRSQPRAAAI
jgi:hypothetical protein